ncbi:MAG: YchJ family protein [Chitinivibrionales bacterium]
MSVCPCGTGKEYEECCLPYISREQKAPTAEKLMRSRYTAFVVGDVAYIHDTIDPAKRDDFDEKSIQDWSKNSQWKSLTIVNTSNGTEKDTSGTVEFIARYKLEGGTREHHEVGTFGKKDDQWYYIDGEMVTPKPIKRESPKVGRNDPCPCGSGMKFKKCCM